VIDEGGQCLWNSTGVPQPCTFNQFSILLTNFMPEAYEAENQAGL